MNFNFVDLIRGLKNSKVQELGRAIVPAWLQEWKIEPKKGKSVALA